MLKIKFGYSKRVRTGKITCAWVKGDQYSLFLYRGWRWEWLLISKRAIRKKNMWQRPYVLTQRLRYLASGSLQKNVCWPLVYGVHIVQNVSNRNPSVEERLLFIVFHSTNTRPWWPELDGHSIVKCINLMALLLTCKLNCHEITKDLIGLIQSQSSTQC